MAKLATASSSSTLPEFKLPELKLANLDLDALFTVHKANLAALHEAQSVLVEAAQAVVKVQYDYLTQAVTEAKAMLGSKELSHPDAVLGKVRTAAEKTVATTKEVIDLGVAAQRRVAELVVQRAAAQTEPFKVALAA
jgi:ligand-binding sensor domain-containing protein